MAKLKVLQNQLISYEKSSKDFLLIDLLSPPTLNKIKSAPNKISLDFAFGIRNTYDKVLYIRNC